MPPYWPKFDLFDIFSVCQVAWPLVRLEIKISFTWSIFCYLAIFKPTPHFLSQILVMVPVVCHQFRDSLHNAKFAESNPKNKISRAEIIYFQLTLLVDHELQVWDLQLTSICKVPFKYVISSGVSRWLVQNWLGDV